MKLIDYINTAKSYIFQKSFFLGVIIAVGSLSPYIFGEDNLAEELAELVVYHHTGEDIDFSPSSEEKGLISYPKKP